MKEFLLRYVFVVAVLSCFVAKAYGFEVDGIEYQTVSTTEVVVSYNNSSPYKGDIVVPATVTYNNKTYTVCGVESSAFKECEGLTSVKLPNSILYIENEAFQNNGLLTSVSLGDCVERIGDHAFEGCMALASIELPASLKEMGEKVFYECQALPAISFPEGIEMLCSEMMYGCSNLASVSLPKSLKQIGDGCFRNCKSLQKLTIPDGVTEIGNEAFYECPSLVSMTIPASVETTGNAILSYCTALKELIIEDAVDRPLEIRDNMVEWSFVKKLHLGRDIKSSNMGGSVPIIHLDSLSEVTLGSGITEINNNLFDGCWRLKEIVIPDQVKRIGKCAFSMLGVSMGEPSLVSVKIGSGVEEIAEEAFCDCAYLPGIELPANVKTIGDRAFERCYNLQSLTLSDGLEQVGIGAFRDCQSLPAVVIPRSLQHISDEMFANCISLASVTLHNHIGSIGDRGFVGCGELKSIELPQTITRIGAYAFALSGLQRVEIPSNVSVIEESAFSSCHDLVSVIIPEGVKVIKGSAFNSCEMLESIEIPSSVTEIGDMAFSLCKGLKTATIGSGVTSIGEKAFYECESLTTINMRGSQPPYLGDYCFASYEELSAPMRFAATEKAASSTYERAALNVPVGAVAAYRAAAGWSDFKTIKEVNFTGIEAVEADPDCPFYIVNGKIRTTDGQEKNPIELFSAAGQRVFAGSSEAAPELFPGVYFIRIDGKAYRICID